MKLSLRPSCRGPFFVQFGSVEDLIGSIWALNIKKSDFYKKSKILGRGPRALFKGRYSRGPKPEAAAAEGAPAEEAAQHSFWFQIRDSRLGSTSNSAFWIRIPGRMCMYTCISIRTHLCICVCMCMRMRIIQRIHVCTCMRICMCMCTCTCKCMRMCMHSRFCISKCMHACRHASL